MIRGTKLLFIFLFIAEIAYCNGKKQLSREDYIKRYSEVAVEEMKIYGIPASITLAQGCLESGDGNSTLAVKANNHFGIKCNNKWNGPSVRHNDDRRNECFRKYKSAWESFRDHSKFLMDNQRYSFLFDLKTEDYKSWAKGLKKAGYATDPNYPQRLIRIIEDYRLYELDASHKSEFADSRSSRKRGKSVDQDRRRGRTDNFSISSYRRSIVRAINGRKYVVAKEGDSYKRVAEEFDLSTWEVRKYNEVHRKAIPPAGSVIFIESKRNRAAKGNNFHILKAGEGMWHISQRYGIRLKSLYRKNRMKPGDPLEVGQKIWLRKRKPEN